MQVIIDVPVDKEAAVLAVLADSVAAPAAAKAASKTAAPVAAPEPTVEEDLLGGAPAAATMADAVELATKLVSEGNSAKVKEALATVGAGRVSELTDDNIQTFVDSLSG